MFSTSRPEPVASGMGVAAATATNQLVHLAYKLVIFDWKKPHIDALSNAFGNFDRVVALGWLLGDALGLPLLEKQAAFTLGGAVRKRGEKIEKELSGYNRDAQRRASKLAADDSARQALKTAADAAAASFLSKEVEPPLRLPGEPASAAHTECRKRKRSEPEAESPAPFIGPMDLMEAADAAEEAANISAAAEVLAQDTTYCERLAATVQTEQALVDALSVEFDDGWLEAVDAAADAAEAARKALLTMRTEKLSHLDAAFERAWSAERRVLNDEVVVDSAEHAKITRAWKKAAGRASGMRNAFRFLPVEGVNVLRWSVRESDGTKRMTAFYDWDDARRAAQQRERWDAEKAARDERWAEEDAEYAAEMQRAVAEQSARHGMEYALTDDYKTLYLREINHSEQWRKHATQWLEWGREMRDLVYVREEACRLAIDCVRCPKKTFAREGRMCDCCEDWRREACAELRALWRG